ncbi:hypothetical protein [Streptomyces sp. DT195]|uniref:hypothetical protein n=1 Tax=Streptomyces sp. DT195 TaxID=3393419 RepID=UPI003CF9B6EB
MPEHTPLSRARVGRLLAGELRASHRLGTNCPMCAKDFAADDIGWGLGERKDLPEPFVPYTRVTIESIRAGRSYSELGWSRCAASRRPAPPTIRAACGVACCKRIEPAA